MNDLEMTEFQSRAFAAGVTKLLDGTTFYTSDLEKLASLAGRALGGKDWHAMQPLHCVKWGDMDPELRRMMKEKCLELLGLPPTILEAEPVSSPAPPKEAPRVARLAFWRR